MSAIEALVLIAAEVLGSDVVPGRGFVAQGGDSIQAMQVTARLSRRTGTRVAPDALLSAKSIEAALAQSAEGLRAAEFEPLVELPGDDPASSGQQQLWFVEMMGGGGPVYNISTAIHLHGRLDLGRMMDACRATAATHDSLRVAFREGSTCLERVVLPAEMVEIECHDLIVEPEGVAEATYEQLARELSCRPFALERGPMTRLALVRRASDLSTVLLVAHHSALDAWSVGLICQEIAERYVCAISDQEFEGWEPPPYRDFVEFEASAKKQWGERDLRWWTEYLAGAPTTIELPSRLERPPLQSFSGRRHGFELQDPNRIRTAAREAEATPFALLLAVFGVCFGRCARRSDFLVGIPIAGREKAELHDLVGFCAKTLPIRVAIEDEEESLDRFARRLQRGIAGVLEHASADLGELSHALGAAGDTSRNPLVQVVFAKHDDLIARGPIGAGISIDFEDLETGCSPFDITLFVERLDSLGRASLEYADEILSTEEAASFAETFGQALNNALDDPRRPIRELLTEVYEQVGR
jgi:hypothetical protein